MRCRQKPDAARFNHARNIGGGLRDKHIALKVEHDAVIGHQVGTKGHQLQKQARLARPAFADDQHAAASARRTTCMKHLAHRLRTMVKTAPVCPSVRLDAVIVPPCASTICRDMARPRPEWSPKVSSGRDE